MVIPDESQAPDWYVFIYNDIIIQYYTYIYIIYIVHIYEMIWDVQFSCPYLVDIHRYPTYHSSQVMAEVPSM